MRIAVMAAALCVGLAACAGGPVRSIEIGNGGAPPDSPFAANRGTAPAPPAMRAASAQTAPPEGAGPGGVDFGQWRSADPAIYGPAFEAQMAARYGSAERRAGARVDLEANGFACRDRPGVLECRIEIMEQSCAKDWYVAFEAERTAPRAGFDVMCLGAER
ncbi:MAG: hypothetical protein GC206_10055 [Alphaproteobacteria bacterium]|nr:hypothetical protein [Alphaproteobacteria bacterium]